MSKHIGNIGDKITAEVKLIHEFQYTDYKFNRYGGTDHFTYIMEDADGNAFVWKTTNIMGMNVLKEERNESKYYDFVAVNKGDTCVLTGTVKEHTEYKGTPQTVLTRCKVTAIEHAPDEEEIKKEQQMQSLEEGDVIETMPYRQYKNHYADCETIAGSYNSEYRTIKVIVRKGRMKPSGVRGEHFSGYAFKTSDGKITRGYRAVSEENARKQMLKDFPEGESWELARIYEYGNYHRIW